MKKVCEEIGVRKGRIVVKGTGNVPKDKELKDIVNSICDNMGYMRSKYVKTVRGEHPTINMDDKAMKEVSLREKIVSMSLKQGTRGQVCKILLEKGKISREEFKKYNKWGDTRFIDEFVNVGYEEGSLVYLLKKECL